MVSSIEVLGIALQALSVLMFGTVAVFIARRPVTQRARGAQRGFVIWWGGLAVIGLYALVFNDTYGIVVAEYGLGPLLAILYILIGILFLLLGGLMYYLLYLYTGRSGTLWWPTVYYLVLMASVVWLLHGFGGACLVPADGGCQNPDWQEGDPAAIGAYDERPQWIGPVFGLALVVPPLVAAVMYFLLYFRVDDPTSKYRILMVSGGIILWFTFSVGNTLVAASTQTPAGDVSALISRSLGVLAAALVLLAYLPPRFVQRRFGVQSISQQMD